MAATRPDQDELVIAAISEGRQASDVWIIDCPYCTHSSYYSQGFTSQCTNCGNEIAQFSDEAYTLEDFWSWAPYPCDVLTDGG